MFLREKGVVASAKSDELGHLVEVSEEIDDALLDAVEARYDQLMDETESLVTSEDAESFAVSGIWVTLGDGRRSFAPVEVALMQKLNAALDLPEIQTLVEAIVQAVETPDDRPLCKRHEG
ncbi:hypothetical protein [Magnetofaba australis]|nr:hypothetical protein [Magnetofaba australis]